jgi:hypothetical protein
MKALLVFLGTRALGCADCVQVVTAYYTKCSCRLSSLGHSWDRRLLQRYSTVFFMYSQISFNFIFVLRKLLMYNSSYVAQNL